MVTRSRKSPSPPQNMCRPTKAALLLASFCGGLAYLPSSCHGFSGPVAATSLRHHQQQQQQQQQQRRRIQPTPHRGTPHLERIGSFATGASSSRRPRSRLSLAEDPNIELGIMGTLRQGIKAVAVGEKGSKPIPVELVEPLTEAMQTIDLEDPGANPLAEQRLASFLGTLFVKRAISETDTAVLKAVALRRPELGTKGVKRGGCSSEQILDLVEREELASSIGKHTVRPASKELTEFARMLLDGKKLSRGEAQKLGQRLFDSDEPAPLRSLCVHILRVRYETPDEWLGLLAAQDEAVKAQSNFDRDEFHEISAKQANSPSGERRKVVQLSEPFDGVNRSHMFTPLIARHLQNKWRMLAVSQCGESSGPKYGPNLRDVALDLGSETAPFAEKNSDITDRGIDMPEFGWYMDQRHAAPFLHEWMTLRRNIIKRPCFATSEKLIDPIGADILISSAFHPSFTDKMFDMADRGSSFPACIIIRKGLEGSIGFGLGKTVVVTCGVRRRSGRYERHDFEFGAKDHGMERQMDAPDRSITTEDLTRRIITYARKGRTEDPLFDSRVELTLAGIDKAMLWVSRRIMR